MARSRGRRSGRRADYRWGLGSTSGIDVAIGSTQAVLFAGGTLSETLMRIRGDIVVGLGATGSTDGDAVLIGAGLIVTQSGATATSLPLTDGDAPFVWHQTFNLLEGAAGRGEAITSGMRAVIDNKSMRVLRPDQDLVLIVESADIVGAPTISFAVAMRFLLAS